MARQVGVRLNDELEKVLIDLREKLHIEDDSDVIRTLLRAAQKASLTRLIQFLYHPEDPSELPAPMREEIERSVKNTIIETVKATGVHVRFTRKQKEGLQDIAERHGFDNLEDFFKDIGARALDDPARFDTLLFGELREDLERKKAAKSL